MLVLLFLLFLLPSWAYAGVPPTLNTWYQIPNSTLFPLCPTDTTQFGECKYIPIAWGSASIDQGRGKFIIHGGGHNNYYGNDIYSLDLNQLGLAGSLTQVIGPSTPVAATGTSPDCIGTPCVSNSKHLYDGWVWLDLLSESLIIGGSPAKNGGFTNSIWTMDPSQTTAGTIWTRLTPAYTTSGTGGSGQTQVIGIIPSASRDKIWSCAYAEWRTSAGVLQPIAYCFDQLNLYSIDRVANVMRSLTNRSSTRQFYVTAAYDPVHKVVALLGGGDSTFATFDVSGGPTVQVPGSGDATLVNRPTTGATNISGTSAPGFVYDPDLDRMVAWGTSAALNTFFVADMAKALANDPGTWSTIAISGTGPDPAIEIQNNSIDKRFNYWKKGRMYIYENGVSTNMWAVRLVAPDNSMRIKETSGSTQTNRPVTVGRPFKQGDIANCPEVWINGSAVTTQTDVKNRWPDGSLKFGMVSFVAPSMTANSTTTAYLINNPSSGSCNNTGGLTQAQALAPGYNLDAVMTLAGTSTVTASLRTMLTAGAATTWMTGPVVTSFIVEDKTAARPYDMAPNGQKTMHPIFEARCYPAITKCEISFILENSWISNTLGNSTRNEALTYSITTGITPVTKPVNWAGDSSETFSTHTFTGMSRSHITAWAGTAPGAILVDHNLSYLGSSRLVPNFSPLTINAARLTTEKNAWSNLTTARRIQGTFNGTTDPIGNWERIGADGGGGHPWIGLFPTWDVMYLYAMSGFDQTMQDKFYGNADLWGRIQLHMRELDVPAGRGLYFDNAYSTAHTAALGRHLSVSARKEVSTQDFSDTCSGTIGTDKINQAATIEWTSYSPRWAPHHAPGASYLQYLLSGRYFYMEEVQMQAAYYLAWAHGCVTSNGGRKGDLGYFQANANNEVRGAAWAYRSMGYALTVSPDGTPEQGYWDWYVKQNRALLEGQSGVTNTDAQHLTAYQFGTSNLFFPDGPSAVGEWTRYLDDGGTSVLREDGTPSRNSQDCNGAGFTCATAPWMENFLLSALGMWDGTGLNVDSLLAFRAKYNMGISLGQVNTAFGDNYRMSGKVQRSYSVAPGNTGEGWMLRWSDLLQYAQPRTTFCNNCGSDQRYQFITLGANAFLGSVSGVYNSDGGTSYTAYRTSLNAQQPLTAQFDGSLSPSDATYDSPKWNMLPWSVTAAGSVIPTPPQTPNPASNVRVTLSGSPPGSLVWARNFGGTQNDIAQAVATTATGDVVVTGSYTGTVNFGTGNLPCTLNPNVFVARYTAAGTLSWVQCFPGTATGTGTGIAVDASDNVIVVGNFAGGTMNFGGGALTAVQQDIFVVKLTGAGAHIWSKNFGGPFSDEAISVALDSGGNILLTGSFQNNINFGGGTITTDPSPSAAFPDIYIAKLSAAAGAQIWAKGIAPTTLGTDDRGRGIAVDDSDNVIVTGSFWNTINFGGSNLTAASSAGSDIFLVKYDSAGAHIWSQRFGTVNQDFGLNVAAKGNAIALDGLIPFGTIDFGCGGITNPGTNTVIYLTTFTAAGVCSWSKIYTNASGNRPNGVTIDASNNVLMTGYFINTVNFGGTSLTATGLDILVLKLTASGALTWVKNFGGASSDIGNGISARANVFIAGQFQGNVDFGAGLVTNAGGIDGVVLSIVP